MEANLNSARAVANMLDNKFRIGPWRFGIDALVGLIPIEGDLLAFLFSLYVVHVGVRSGLPRESILRMLGNLGIAFVIGLLPVIGDAAYVAFRPNMRNLAILEHHLVRTTSD